MSPRGVALCILLAAVPAALAQKKAVTVEAAADHSDATVKITWAPDGKRFVYEQDRVVGLYDVATKTRRELIRLDALENAATPVVPRLVFDWQNRGVRERTVQWFPLGSALLVSAGGDLFQVPVAGDGRIQITSTNEAERDPKLSPDGRRVSFRRENDLYSMEIATRRTIRLTRNGSETLHNGRLDWVYPEELDLATAHWWSPDSRRIAYLQFDVSREPLYPHADLLPFRPVSEPQRYPKAGEPNAVVRVGVVAASGGSTRWMDLGDTRDSLVARVVWAPDSRALYVLRLNRVQKRLDLVRVEADRGSARVVLSEQDSHWVNLGEPPKFIAQGQEFLWASERDGFRHLYRYSADGRLLGRLTEGQWEVSEVAGVDEVQRRVYFVSTEVSPLERQLYQVSLDGGPRRRISQPAGTHTISVAPGCAHYLDAYSGLQTPVRRVIFEASGTEWAVFSEADLKPSEEYDIRPVEIVPLKTSDGAQLYARLIRPAGFEEGRRYPAIVFVYGGPHSQSVRDAWQGLSLEQVLAHRGFVVWQLDNRGSSGRGHAWESVLDRELGAKELADQEEGVRHLVSMGFVDKSRLGIHGWSYGGFLTLYSLLHAPDLFRAGVAGAPVTDWRNYDTIYTERYLGLPSENAEGYRRSSPVYAAANLKAKLLLLHNFEDDNVLFQNTLQIADALERAGRPFQMMIYPQKTHGVTGNARRHMWGLIASFFSDSLGK